MMEEMDNNVSMKFTGQVVKRFLRLGLDNMRLTLTEKLTVLFSAMAFFVIAIALCAFVLVFISVGVVKLLTLSMPEHFACMLVSVVYMIVFGVLYVLRRKIIVDPIARFLSRLLVKPPKTNSKL